MKKNLKLAIVLAILAVIGCKKNIEQTDPLEPLGKITGHTVSLQQATQMAEVNSLYPGSLRKPRTASRNANGKISAMSALPEQKKAKTIQSTFSYKNGQKDPVLYILNYKEKGFIIISGDDRLYPVLAKSDDSSFPVDKMNDLPKGIAIWLKNITGLVQKARSNNEVPTELVSTTWKEFEMKIELANGNTSSLTSFPECLEEGATFWDQVSHGPLLTTTWGQRNGYNDNAPYLGCTLPTNGYAYTGCVATAMAQVMRYHQFPTSYSWSSMLDYTGTSSTAVLMRDVGNSVSMSWGCVGAPFPYGTGSGAYTSNVDNALKNVFSYSTASYASYAPMTVRADIYNNKPVVLDGTDSSAGGHAWVADGVLENTLYTCHLGEGPIEGRGVPPPSGGYWTASAGYLYFHMNWGWDGAYNGWFGYNGFTPTGYNFNSSLGMVTNITP